MTQRLYLILLIVATLGMSGCVVSPLVTGNNSGGGTRGGQLYVSTAGSILRYSNALAANGNVAPDVTLSATSSQLSSPKRILLDVNTDRLFVANQGGANVLIFSPASKMAAGTTPSAVLSSTGNMVSPVDVAIDPGANLLYVADGQNILVFTGESSLSGPVNVAPARTISFVFTVDAIFLDATNNRMFIADAADNAVDILPNVSGVNGAATLLLSPISGPSTTLAQTNGLALDGTGRLVVSNGGASPAILFFPSLIIPAGGDTGPVATISGSATKVAAPGQLVFNPNNNSGELYVADSQAPGILVFTSIASANGSITSAPTRAIVGSGTQLNVNAVNGVALDTTR